ncbi:MAG: Spi family protease inhibitor [Spirosomataceae bacterium]
MKPFPSSAQLSIRSFAAFTLALSIAVYSCKTNEMIPTPHEQPLNNPYAISIENAVLVAESFDLSQKDQHLEIIKNARPAGKEVEKKETVYDENKEALFHVLNFKEGGYVIVSADVRAIPVLSFSEKNTFDLREAEQTNGLKLWMMATKEKVKKIKKEEKPPHDIVLSEWKKYLKEGFILPNGKTLRTSNQNCQEWYTIGQYMCQNSTITIGPLMQTHWGQMGIASLFCPTSYANDGCQECGHAPAGCGPIAVGQVARELFVDVPNVNPPFDYAAMPTWYWTACDLNTPGDLQLAVMTSAIGVSVGAQYNFFATCNTLIYPWTIPQGLTAAGLNGGAVQQRTFGDAGLIQSEVSQGYPLIFYGYDAGEIFTSWHIWVCDGYMSHQYKSYNCDTQGCDEWSMTWLNMNWGWHGASDGWYAFGNFNPGGDQYDSYLHYYYNIRR